MLKVHHTYSKLFNFVLLVTLTLLFLEIKAHQTNQDLQLIQQFHRANWRRNRNQNGYKINNIPEKSHQIRREKPFKSEDTGLIKLIPGLGSVKGRKIISEWSEQSILQFFDIPYAKSTSGHLRFKPPKPITPWKNVLNAEKPHHGCPSLQDVVSYDVLQSKGIDVEDCLRLTINTKSVNGSVPVMVYVHGDFLYDGSSLEAAPGYLLEENIVLVAIRYRLGPFGFLSTLTDEIPGNVGVMDVILALQWIQDHITVFGGDPKRVTLFGQVAGAAIVNVLTMSPIVPEGLFHRVIYHSGTALSPFFVTDNPLASAREIGRLAGCKNVNKINTLNKCLTKLNTTELLEAFRQQTSSKVSKGIGLYNTVQFVIGGPSGVLPLFPAQILTSGNFKAYPTIGGSVSNGGTFILRDIYFENLNDSIMNNNMTGIEYVKLIIRQINGADSLNKEWLKFAEENVFSPEAMKNATFYTMIPGLIDLCSTIAFKNPILQTMQMNAQKLPNSTFLYSFDYEGEINRFSVIDDADGYLNDMPFELGVSLTDENLYLFPWPRYSLLTSNSDIKIAKRMISYWTSFATNGQPSAPNVPEWPAMNHGSGPYLKIGKTVSINEKYFDEFTVAVKDSQNGFNLANDEFFLNIIDLKDEEPEASQKTDYAKSFKEKGRGNILLITTNKDIFFGYSQNYV